MSHTDAGDNQGQRQDVALEFLGPEDRWAVYEAQLMDLVVRARGWIAPHMLPIEIARTHSDDGMCPSIQLRSAGPICDGEFRFEVHVGSQSVAEPGAVEALIAACERYDGKRDVFEADAAAARGMLSEREDLWADGMSLNLVTSVSSYSGRYLCAEFSRMQFNLRPGVSRVAAGTPSELVACLECELDDHRSCMELLASLAARQADLYVEQSARIAMAELGLTLDDTMERIGNGHLLEVTETSGSLPYNGVEFWLTKGVLRASFLAKNWTIQQGYFLPNATIIMPEAAAIAAQGQRFGDIFEVRGGLADLQIEEVILDAYGIKVIIFVENLHPTSGFRHKHD